MAELTEHVEIYNLVQQRKENSAPGMADVIKQLDLTEKESDLLDGLRRDG
ncbi:MAG: hypothetical protein AB1556_15560 [Bacillota bacterium]